MYTESDLEMITKQRRKRWIILAIPAVLALAAVVVTVCFRWQVWTVACTVLFGVLLIGGYGLFIKPLSDYAKHLNNALHGRVREAELTFDHVESEKATVEGVDYFPMTCTEINDAGKVEEHLFYWDCQKKFPEIEKGTAVKITYHDREVCDISVT